MSTDVYSTGPTVVCQETVGLVLGVPNVLGASAYADTAPDYGRDTAPDYGRDTAPAAYATSKLKSHSFENAYAQANVAGNTMYLTCKDVAAVNTDTGSPNNPIEYGYVQAIAEI